MDWVCHHLAPKMRRHRLHSHQRVLRTISKEESVTLTHLLGRGWLLFEGGSELIVELVYNNKNIIKKAQMDALTTSHAANQHW